MPSPGQDSKPRPSDPDLVQDHVNEKDARDIQAPTSEQGARKKKVTSGN